jgi:hypothetical protein
VVLFVHAALAITGGALWWQAEQQDRTFEAFVAPVVAPGTARDERTAVELMDTVHAFGRRFRREWSCGQFSGALMRSLRAAGYNSRFVQMRAEGIWGQHIVVEAAVGQRWVLLDPLYDLAFHRPDGRLASALELQRDWPVYVSQVPRRYDPKLRYEAFRYTNWDAFPLWLIRPAAAAVFGEAAVATFSLSSHLLNRPRVAACAVGGVWLAWAVLSLSLWRAAASRRSRSVAG